VTTNQASGEEIAWMSAAQLGRRISRRELSAAEVVEATIERIEQRNPSLNAFVYKGFDDARKAAAAADEAIRSGREVGALHGVPVAIKDLFDFKPGWPATFGGVRALANNVLPFHCMFAERMERAGAVLVGKTNSPPMGLRGTCDNYSSVPHVIPSTPPATPAAPPAAARPQSRTASFHSRKAPTEEARSGSRPPGAVSTVTRPRLDGCH